MATQEDRNQGTDGSSIKPVSSLRSHFEALKSSKPSIESVLPPRDSPPRFLHHERAQTTDIARASLDLGRPRSPWSSLETEKDARQFIPRTPGGLVYRSGSPSQNGHKRPISWDFRSIPHPAPSVTVQSPKSPSKTAPTSRSGSTSPERLMAVISSSKVSNFDIQLPQSSPLPVMQQTTHENLGVKSQGQPKTSNPVNSFRNPPRTSSVPPAVNRADKPKISWKSKTPTHHEARRLTPEPVGTPRRRVSPFSTPPSSESSPSPERQDFLTRNIEPETMTNEARTKKLPADVYSRQSNQHQRDPRVLGFSGPTSSIEPCDARSLGFSANAPIPSFRDQQSSPSRASTVSERWAPRHITTTDAHDPAFSNQRSAQRHVSEQIRTLPPPAIPEVIQSGSSAVQRDRRKLGISEASTTGFQVEGPAHRGTRLPPSQEWETRSNNRTPLPPPQVSDKSTKPVPPTRKALVPPVEVKSDFPPPPRRKTHEESPGQDQFLTKPGTAPPQSLKNAPRHIFKEDSDEAEINVHDLPIARSEYPDSSQANRRPPHFSCGAQEIPTKFDSRVFDICGRYVCTTGYVTRTWDLSRGEQIFSLSHGETIKMVSVVFKPGQSLEDEGARIWVGSNIGELHEIEVAKHAIVATSAVHNRREVIRILRHKKDLWTLDEEGKLFVWRAEESRMASLKYSHHAHRVPRGHTFSMIVHNKLWYATGRDLRVFRPGDEASFSVLQKPLSQPGTGDITSGTYTNREGGRVYLGHADGRVSIYAVENYACVGVIKASDYKINAISFVGENLWTAYKTGKIYVYDTSHNPWKVKKDWRAHDGPAASMLLDRSSTWMLNRLQVASLGHDNCIRLWDGTLEDDWLEAAMQSRNLEYCTFREVRAAVVSWNVGACNPSDIRNDFISDAIHVDDPPEILVFGFQEIVDLEDRAVTAKSILGFGKRKDKENARSEQHVGRVYRAWRDYLGQCINRYTDPRYSYTEVHTSCLIGLLQCIFVRQEEKRSIRNMSATEVKCGMKGHYGNKGALVTRFMLDDSSLCFINCHLAAGQTQTSHRNNDIAAILETESLPVERDPVTRTSFFVGGGDGTQVLDHEICILNGDLNYRIDAVPRETAINMINKGELEELLERDQLILSRRRVSGFRLSAFHEAPITFAPTYKYDVGSDKYDSSEKRRPPAWCDRLLYRGVGRIKQVEYRRHEIRVSDHRPVSGTFKIRIKTIDADKQEQARAQCHEQFEEAQRRLVDEASIEYLVSSLGMTEQDAWTAVTEHR